jgi:outer membrane murein-binding lipoprotein Lpp
MINESKSTKRINLPIAIVISIAVIISGIISSYAVNRERVDTLRSTVKEQCNKNEMEHDAFLTVLEGMKIQMAKQEQVSADVQRTLERVDRKLDRIR